ncbi:SemiSWEET family sugar transporter [Rubrolithibacter danxiaensis]|uniref:SemiSWEET family sugar transporter n=1 Tax=Rubrolithibacter danxiaensis TaxID=3390805 RepID=UPI003BF82844
MDKNQIIGLVAGILTSASLLPQLIKTIRNRKAEDVAPFMFVMLLGGTGLWTYYGVLRSDLPIIITNAFSFSLNVLMLILKFKYSGNK